MIFKLLCLVDGVINNAHRLIWGILKFLYRALFTGHRRMAGYYSRMCFLTTIGMIAQSFLHVTDEGDARYKLISEIFNSFDLTAIAVIITMISLQDKLKRSHEVMPFFISFFMTAISVKVYLSIKNTLPIDDIWEFSVIKLYEEFLFYAFVPLGFFISVIHIAWWLVNVFDEVENKNKGMKRSGEFYNRFGRGLKKRG